MPLGESALGCCQLVDAMTARPHRCLLVRGIATEGTPGPEKREHVVARVAASLASSRETTKSTAVSSPVSRRSSGTSRRTSRAWTDLSILNGHGSEGGRGSTGLREETTWAKRRRDRGGHQTSGASGEYAGRLTIRGTVRASGRDTGTCAAHGTNPTSLMCSMQIN